LTLNGLDRLHVVSPCKGMFVAAILEQLRWGVVLQVVVLQVVVLQVVQEKSTRCFSKGSSALQRTGKSGVLGHVLSGLVQVFVQYKPD
jgi:hypothetical protein